MRTHHHYLLKRLCDFLNRDSCLLTEEAKCGPASSSPIFNLRMNPPSSPCEAHSRTIIPSVLKASSTNGDNRLQKHRKKLFTPLFSTKGVYAKRNSKLSQIKGTGLGLSLAKQLMEEQDYIITLNLYQNISYFSYNDMFFLIQILRYKFLNREILLKFMKVRTVMLIMEKL